MAEEKETTPEPGPAQETLPGEAQVGRIAAAYGQAGVKLRRLVLALVTRDTALTAAQRLAIYERVLAILQEAFTVAEPLIRSGALEAAGAGADAVPARIRHLEAERLIRANLQGSLEDLAARKADEGLRYLRAQEAVVGRRVDDLVRRIGLEGTLTKLERQLTGDQQAKLLREELDRRGALAEVDGRKFFRDRAGRHYKPEHYATLVARTTTREARSQGVILRARASGRDLVKVSSHPGGAVDPICVPYQGRVFSLSGATPGRPVLEKAPPFHPNCRHVLVIAADAGQAPVFPELIGAGL